MQPDLFSTTACRHLPLRDRKFISGALVCHKCGKVLRTKEGKDVSMEAE
jgi:hypothetical protein